jgi:L-ribulose-5-phosphate 4-epimerase
MSAVAQEVLLSPEVNAFVEATVAFAEQAFEVFRKTGTTTANGTVQFVERVPNADILVSVGDAGPWVTNRRSSVSVVGFDGTVYRGKSAAGGTRYLKIFQQHPGITTVAHVHSPYLGAWAQTHRSLPIRYVPVQRFQLAREIPVYIDRRQAEPDFILDKLRENEHTTAILEANGGATVWGRKGLRDTAEFILLLEEGAQLQVLAEAIGGSREPGPGVLKQQWKMGGIYEQALSLGLLPATDR